MLSWSWSFVLLALNCLILPWLNCQQLNPGYILNESPKLEHIQLEKVQIFAIVFVGGARNLSRQEQNLREILGTGTPQKTNRAPFGEWGFAANRLPKSFSELLAKVNRSKGGGHTTEGRVSMKNLWGPTNLASCWGTETLSASPPPSRQM